MIVGLLLSILLGWLAGGLANWAADVLPGRSPGKAGGGAASNPETSEAVPTPGRGGPISALHYLTLPWYPFRGGVCPHCGARRPLRAPLLEAATIVAFILPGLDNVALGFVVYFQLDHKQIA